MPTLETLDPFNPTKINPRAYRKKLESIQANKNRSLTMAFVFE
jgi:hypothetical protein